MPIRGHGRLVGLQYKLLKDFKVPKPLEGQQSLTHSIALSISIILSEMAFLNKTFIDALNIIYAV